MEHLFKPEEIRPGEHALIRRIPGGLTAVIHEAGCCRLVAARDIAAGTALFQIAGQITSEATRYSVQVDKDLHLSPAPGRDREEEIDADAWQFLNHSCTPNTILREREFRAVRDINRWEDITFDYNTTEYEMAEPFQCLCGHANCRGTIAGYKHLSAGEQERLRPRVAVHLIAMNTPGIESGTV